MINEIIIKYRKINKMSQSILGEIIGYSQDTISLWENGKAIPDYNALRKLCVIFNLEPNELMEMETEQQRKMVFNSLNKSTKLEN